MKSIAVYYKIHEGIESSENYDEKQKGAQLQQKD